MKTILNKMQMIVLGCYDLIRAVVRLNGPVGGLSTVVYGEAELRELEERLEALMLEVDDSIPN